MFHYLDTLTHVLLAVATATALSDSGCGQFQIADHLGLQKLLLPPLPATTQ
jgi:hypothetical protein